MRARAPPLVGEVQCCNFSNVVHIAVSELKGLFLVANCFCATAGRLKQVDRLQSKEHENSGTASCGRGLVL